MRNQTGHTGGVLVCNRLNRKSAVHRQVGRIRTASALAAGTLLMAAGAASADTNWILGGTGISGGGTGFWQTAANWSANTPDTGVQNAVVSNGGTVQINQNQLSFDFNAGTVANSSGTYSQMAGTMTVNSWFRFGTTAGAKGTYQNTGGVLNMAGTGQINIGENSGTSTAATSALNISGGTLNNTVAGASALVLGGAFTGTGVGSGMLNLSGTGTVNTVGELWIGQNAGSTGVANVTGGTFNASNWVAVGRASATGTLNISGTGVFNKLNATGNLTLAGIGTTQTGTINMTGGTLNNTFSGTWIGETAKGVFNISAGAANLGGTAGYLDIGRAGGTGTVNLSGTGVINTNVVQKTSGTGTFNFSGGVLQAAKSNATFMQGLTAANVQAGGFVFDANTFTDTIGQNLLHSGAGTDGGVTLLSSGATKGVLRLTGANTYNGATNVSAGALDAVGLTSVPNWNVSGNVTVASGAAFAVGVGTGQFTAANVDTVRTTATFAANSYLGLDTTNGNFSYGSVLTDTANGPLGLLVLGNTVANNSSSVLTLAVSSSYTGGTLVHSGVLNVQNAGAIGTGSLQQANTFNALNSRLSGVQLQGGITLSNSLVLSNDGTGGVTAVPYALDNVSGNNSVTGPIAIAASGGSAVLQSDSGTFTVTGNASPNSAGTRGLIFGGVSTAGNTYSGILSNGSGVATLGKTGVGYWSVTGPNTYTGATTISAGTLNLGVAENVGVSGPLGVGNTITFGTGSAQGVTGAIQFSPVNQFDYSSRFATTTNQGIGIDTNGQSVAFGTNINSAGGQLVKYGAGTLTLNGLTNTVANFHTRGGTVVLPTGTSLTTTAFSDIGVTTGDVGKVTLNGTANLTIGGDFNISDINGSSGVLNVLGTGTAKGVTLYLGKSGTATGLINQTGGAVVQTSGNDSRIGGAGSAADVASVGFYNLAGGTFTTPSNQQVGAFGTGYLAISGGTFTAGNFADSGRFAGGYGHIDVTAGAYNQSNATTKLIVGEAGTGFFTVRGTGAVNLTGGLVMGLSNTASGVFNLDTGGTLTTPLISAVNGTPTAAASAGPTAFNFNGGTLKNSVGSSTTPFMNGMNAANVFAGGAIIDTTAGDLLLPQALVAPAGSGVTSIPITSGGSGYVTAPVVKLTGGGGFGATAVANLDATGSITGFTITNPGTGYTSAPAVSLVTGLLTPTTPAVLGSAVTAPNTSGGLTKLGGNNLILTSASTYTGPTVISGGSLQLGNGTTDGSISSTSSVTNNAALNYNLLVSRTAAYPISGTGTVTLNDTGTTKGNLTLTASSSYTGATSINSGNVILDHSGVNLGALGNTAVTVNGGSTLFVRGSTNIGNAAGADLNLSSGPTLDLRDTTINSLGIGGNLSLNSTTISMDLGTTSGSNDVLNVLGSVSNGGTSTIYVNTLGAIAAGTSNYVLINSTAGGLTPGGSGFTLANAPAGFNQYTFANTTANQLILTITANASQSAEYWTGKASSNGGDGNNSWGFGAGIGQSNWATTLAGTTDALQVPFSITDVYFTATNAVVNSGNVNTQLDSSYSIKGLTFDTSTATSTISNVGIETSGNVLTIGADGLTVASADNSVTNITGGGSILLNGNQTWANNSPNALNVSPNISGNSNGGVQTFTYNGTGAGVTTLGGAISDGTLGGTLSMTVNNTGSGSLVLSGNNTFSGGLTVNAGNVQLNNNYSGNGGFTVNNGTVAVNGNYSGTAGIVINNGLLQLNSNNSFTGGLLINNGIVSIGNGGALNNSVPNTVTFGPATTGRLQLSGNSPTAAGLISNATLGAPIVENANSGNAILTIAPPAATTYTYAGVIQDGVGGGTLAIQKTGLGTQVLSGSNSYSGLTNVGGLGSGGGSLQIANNNGLGNTSGVFVYTTSDLALANGVTVTGKTVTIDGAGTGLEGALTTVAGATATWAGNVVLGNSGMVATTARIGANTGGTLNLPGSIIGVNGGGSANGVDFSGVGPAPFGNIVLSGSNSYTGTTSVIRGNVVAASGTIINTLGNITTGSSGTVGDQASLTIQTGANVSTAANIVTGTGNAISVLNVSGGTLTAASAGTNGAAFVFGSTALGSGITTNATYLQTGGVVSSGLWFTLGFSGAGSNTANVSGGVLNVNTLGVPGSGANADMEITVYDTQTATFTLNGGTLNLDNSANIAVGSRNATVAGNFILNSGTVNFYSDAGTTLGGTGNLIVGRTATGAETVRLNGGTLNANSITRTSTGGSGTVYFNGTTLVPNSNTSTNTPFVGAGNAGSGLLALTNAYISTGGAILNVSSGLTTVITQPLLHDGAGAAVDGGLIKNSPGTLQLTNGSSTFNGNVIINSGTLIASSTNVNSGNPVNGLLGNTVTPKLITLANGTTLNFAIGNVLSTGAYNPANVTMNISGGTLTNTSGDTESLGVLNLNNATITSSSGTGNFVYQSYVLNDLITVTGTTPSTFSTLGTVNQGYHLGVGSNKNITFNVDPTGTGASLVVSAPLIPGSGANSTGSAITKTGLGVMTLSGSNTYAGGTTVAAGTLNLVGAGAYPSFTDLTIASGATTIVAAHTTGGSVTPYVNTLSNAGLINVTNNSLVVHNTSGGALTAMTAQLKSGYNNGLWNGTTGITSSNAAADTTHLTAVGIMLNDTGANTGAATGTGIYSTFGTSFPGVGDILTKYTYYGDANLSGAVDGSDYSLIDNGYLLGLTGWYNGDFNYDGLVNGSDYTLMDNAYNTQGAAIASAIASPTASVASQIAGTSSVPEPTTLGVVALGAAGLLGRRRRRI